MKRLSTQFKSGLEFMTGLLKREVNYHLLRPTNILLFLTYRCTSRCATCTIWRKKPVGGELSLGEWQRFIDSACRWPIRNVEMFGGDALLRKDVLFPLTKHVKSRGIQVDLVTNCNLLDAKAAEQIVDAGFDAVYISVDGVDKHHDRVRGVEGTFNRVEQAVKHLLRARGNGGYPRLAANCTVSNHNVAHFEEVLDYADSMGFDSVAFEYVGEFPDWSIKASLIDGVVPTPYYVQQDSGSVLLDVEQARLLKRKLKDVKEQAKTKSLYLRTGNIDLLRVRDMVHGHCPHSKCYVCRYLITVDPSGNLLGCPFFNNYFLGNFSETPLERIWGNERHLRFIRAIDTRKPPMCRFCILSIERNQSLLRSLTKKYYTLTGRGRNQRNGTR